jgi:hypothetical protein
MGVVTSGQKFLGIKSNINTDQHLADHVRVDIERKHISAAVESSYFTIEDIQSYASEVIDALSNTALTLTKPVSLISTEGGAAAGTLAAGSEGQIKIINFNTDGGNATITVTNHGWNGEDGTLTFADAGDSVTLIYLSAKWRIISNVGAVAAS